MKKYWKFTATIAVIVLSIGAFYVNSALSAPQYPEFAIKKQSGDANEMKSLVLDGGYHEGNAMSYTNTHLKINSDGSEIRNGLSLVDQVRGQPSPVIKDLQTNYRDFMRGKSQSINSFFENDELLAYADVKYKISASHLRDFKFDISILTKDEGNTTSFNVNVPDASAADYIFVEDVQVIDNELKVISQNTMRKNDKFFTEKHIYTLDISAGTITNNEKILSIPQEQGNSYVDAQLINTNPLQANENVVFLITHSNYEEGLDGLRESSSSKEILFYNLKTQKTDTIEMPESLNDNQVSFLEISTIYFSKFSEQNLIVTPFSVENHEVGDEFTIQLSNEISDEVPPLIIVKESKLYAVSQIMNSKTNASVAVVNVKTGESLYEGEVVMKNSPKSIQEFELYMYEMTVN